MANSIDEACSVDAKNFFTDAEDPVVIKAWLDSHISDWRDICQQELIKTINSIGLVRHKRKMLQDHSIPAPSQGQDEKRQSRKNWIKRMYAKTVRRKTCHYKAKIIRKQQKKE